MISVIYFVTFSRRNWLAWDSTFEADFRLAYYKRSQHLKKLIFEATKMR